MFPEVFRVKIPEVFRVKIIIQSRHCARIKHPEPNQDIPISLSSGLKTASNICPIGKNLIKGV
jgi:hypothetical protein